MSTYTAEFINERVILDRSLAEERIGGCRRETMNIIVDHTLYRIAQHLISLFTVRSNGKGDQNGERLHKRRFHISLTA